MSVADSPDIGRGGNWRGKMGDIRNGGIKRKGEGRGQQIYDKAISIIGE